MGKKIPPANPATWQDFGIFLFAMRDADPGYYVMTYLRETGYKDDQLKRFAVAWCSYYNLGIAAKASELQGKKFYEYLLGIYPTAKRATERRHFRGRQGMQALTQWQHDWPKPEAMADYIMSQEMLDIRAACGNVMQMGDYFKWKWGDITEVIWQKPVNFHGFEKVSPELPRKGATLIAQEAGKPDLSVQQVYRAIAKQMRNAGVVSYYAPWRAFDVQDAETICCVYKQYRSGSYHPGIRTAKAYTRLYNDGEGCKTAVDAWKMLLRRQPHPLLQKPSVLGEILEARRIYTVKEMMK